MQVRWCVFTDATGRFKHARPAGDGRIAWSLLDWADLDPEAAAQFGVDVEAEHEQLQQRFMRVSGLDRALV